MPKPDHARPAEPRAERAELVRLVRRVQALTLELQEPRHATWAGSERSQPLGSRREPTRRQYHRRMSPVRPTLQVVGRRMNAEHYRLRDFLTRTAQPYEWHEAGSAE